MSMLSPCILSVRTQHHLQRVFLSLKSHESSRKTEAGLFWQQWANGPSIYLQPSCKLWPANSLQCKWECNTEQAPNGKNTDYVWEGGMVSNGSVLLLASVFITGFQLPRHVVSRQEEVMTLFMFPFPWEITPQQQNRSTATHSCITDPTLMASHIQYRALRSLWV